ncbi:MAG: DUF4398 domain-containing protein [Spirochaetes bacterium]|jgi:nucleoid-associated protein YgaU|nr:DUF4398 domain-containing protein [Spirochaetota bacterium]
MKNSHVRRTAFLASILLPVVVTVSCRLDVPIREMTRAKTAIGRAVEVKAEKYAPEELKLAEASLLKSHEYVAADDTKKAAEEALRSIEQSEAAIAKSLPLLAAESMENARKEYAEAEALYAEKLAPEEFAAAGESLKLAEARMAEQAYWDSHLASLESARQSSAAKTRALAGLPGLRSEIDRIRTESEELKKSRGTEFAPEELAALDEKLAKSDEAIGRNSIKEAAGALAGSDELLAAASAKTYEALAKENLAAAEAALARGKDAGQAEEYTTEIQSAEALIAESRTHLDNKAFQNSIEKSGEAIAILNAMAIAIEKRAEEERLAAGEGKDEAISKTPPTVDDEAEYIQPSVKEYVVKFNPKKRDCLWRISLYVYRDARLWPLIYVANRDKIKDPDLIFPGQKFVIPPVPRKRAEKEPVSTLTDEKKEEDRISPEGPPEDGKNDGPAE